MISLNSHTVISIMALFLASTAVPGAGVAQDRPTGFVALGAAAQPDDEGSDDYDAGPFLAARVAFGETQLELEGLSGRLDVSRIDGFGFGPAFR